ncbi:MAG: GntR family transcriptional regulator [Planctomycetota bacterium]|nr:MAG: GntR family transcriptional regulator [Planctomycetota bacterium]
MPIDPNGPVPLYQQIADYIRQLVAAGVFRSAEALPSLRALAVQLAVNPNTVQRAYDQLEREGLVYARRGLGLFVAERGAELARNKSQEALYQTFMQAILAGKAAQLSGEKIGAIFQRALAGADVKARNQ